MKQIQIEEDVFWKMVNYIFDEDSRTPEIKQKIEGAVNRKIQRQLEHDLYSIYKTTNNEILREQARKEYLDSKGIPENFRW